jgi:hypothetical protein
VAGSSEKRIATWAACDDRDVTARAKLLAPMAALMVALGGCGSATKVLHPVSPARPANASPGVPADVVRVIVGWSAALRAGHVAAAARYFRIPSVFFFGSGAPIELRSLAQVEAVNAALPCGAAFVSARVLGRYVNALFRLTNRPGPGGAGGCGSGTGQTARTNFLIRDGQIVAWLRAPDEPGDNGSPTQPPPPTQTTPGTTQRAPGPAV